MRVLGEGVSDSDRTCVADGKLFSDIRTTSRPPPRGFVEGESRTPTPPPGPLPEASERGSCDFADVGYECGRVTASPLRIMVGNGRLSESPLQFGIDRHIGEFFCLSRGSDAGIRSVA